MTALTTRESAPVGARQSQSHPQMASFTPVSSPSQPNLPTPPPSAASPLEGTNRAALPGCVVLVSNLNEQVSIAYRRDTSLPRNNQ